MNRLKIKPSLLQGKVKVPSSKSHSIRSILFASMAKGKSILMDLLDSPDIHHTILAAKMYGAKIEGSVHKLVIEGTNGKFKTPEDVIEAGNSGQVLRFVGAFAALNKNYTIITGDDSVRSKRPVKPLLGALQQLGAQAFSSRQNDLAPIVIKGIAKPSHVQMDGEDSQPVSGILMLAAFLKGNTEIQVANPGETPWIDLTLSWMKKMHINVSHNNYTHYTIEGGKEIKGFEYRVPGDFSSAAFPAVAALCSKNDITIENIDFDDIQGDKKFFDALKKMGAQLKIDKDKRLLTMRGNSSLKGCVLDINEYIDAVTILAVLGCFTEGQTHIKNATIARKKESDRIHAICKELKKMGAKIEEKEDGFIVRNSELHGAQLNGHHDHRIAMSLTIAALHAKGESTIDGIDCIKKSYPSFIEQMKDLGAKLEIQ